jgi:L-threonylcarbamoyladenylate synthase
MEGQLLEAVDILRGGGVVAFSTDTVYGLGADATNENAILKVYQAKKRPLQNAIPLLLSDASEIADVARDIPQLAWRLAERFLPGGLTLVLYRLPSVSPVITGGSDKIAVRVPDHPVPIEIIRGLGRPMTGTSANLTGSPDALTAADVREQMGDSIDLIIDSGRCRGKIASTVIDLTIDPPVILRQGAVGYDDIASMCEVGVKEV